MIIVHKELGVGAFRVPPTRATERSTRTWTGRRSSVAYSDVCHWIVGVDRRCLRPVPAARSLFESTLR